MRAWLEQGSAGTLDYMKRFFERREKFLQLIPDVRSIAVLTVPYAREAGRVPSNTMPSGDSGARIARYAAGRDYHRLIRRMLKKLAASLRAAAGPEARVVATVDTSPISEKSLAEAGGIGFFGKNTCLIQPRGGSYFFLATLLTNLELPPDLPIRWDCGSCTLCVQACPTGALQEPYHLDANLCISALTIENRGEIPVPLRPLLKEWLFGCDICQEVCPYNHESPSTSPPSRAGALGPSLPEILQIRTDQQFQQHFSETALKRPGRAGMLRNAAITAGNLSSTETLESLKDALEHDPSDIVRSHAAWALKQLQNK